MNMDELWLEVETHVKAAHHSLHCTDKEDLSRRGLDYWYEAEDWRQVLTWLKNLGKTEKSFPPEFWRELSAAKSALEAYDRMGMRSVFDGLNAWEKHVIGECLRAASYGPFFQEADREGWWDTEFSIIFRLERKEVASIADAWPDVEESDENVYTAINNSINNLLGYPHRKHDLWFDHISASHREVYEVYNWFKQLSGRKRARSQPSSPGHEYFLNFS